MVAVRGNSVNNRTLKEECILQGEGMSMVTVGMLADGWLHGSTVSI